MFLLSIKEASTTWKSVSVTLWRLKWISVTIISPDGNVLATEAEPRSAPEPLPKPGTDYQREKFLRPSLVLFRLRMIVFIWVNVPIIS